MPVTAKFLADFSDFDRGVTEASAKLDAFGESGGRAKADLQDLAVVAGQGVQPFNTLKGSLQQFDGALAAVGIRVGPEVRALGELSDVAGKTARDVGLLGVAGLAVGAAMGGWKIGRMVSEFFDLDVAIGNSTAKLLGWGDVAAATAGAKADVLARATSTAKREITDYSEAIRINYAELQRRTGIIVAGNAAEKSAAEARAAFMKKAYAEEAAAAEKLQALQDRLFGRDLITKASEYSRALGDVSNVSKLMPSQQAEMNKALLAAIDALNRAGLGASATAVKFHELLIATTDWAAVNAKVAASPDPFAANRAARNAAFRETQTALMDENQGLTDSARYWAHAGEIADESMKKASDAVTSVVPPTKAAAGAVRQEFTLAFRDVGNAADSMAARVSAVLNLAKTNQKNAGMTGATFGTASTLNAMAARNVGLTIPSFGSGGPVLKDGPIYAHKGEYVLPEGTRGGNVTVNASISITGQGETAGREAADALLKLLKNQGVRI